MKNVCIGSRLVAETPFAVIDFETTGLRAGADRVVEVAIVRVDPGQAPKLVLDTLVNPQRYVSATEIHGITDDDVVDAPSFREIAADVAHEISGAIVASYNVYFDLPFLQHELSSSGQASNPPHLCVMYLRRMLGIGKRCGLDDACSCHGISRSATHMASADAMAAAQLITVCLKSMQDAGIQTFDDLRQLKDYKFTASFDLPPLSVSVSNGGSRRIKSRSGFGSPSVVAPPAVRNPIAVYWETLAAVLSDLVITEEEIETLAHKKRECGLAAEQVRALHARAFAHVINQFVDDRFLDASECTRLNRLYMCLGKLGWAPGQLA